MWLLEICHFNYATNQPFLFWNQQNINFVLKGPDEDVPRSMDCIEFVCRAPSELFKELDCHPPFIIPRKPNLDELTQAADQILDSH
jgi:hypothetical protein